MCYSTSTVLTFFAGDELSFATIFLGYFLLSLYPLKSNRQRINAVEAHVIFGWVLCHFVEIVAPSLLKEQNSARTAAHPWKPLHNLLHITPTPSASDLRKTIHSCDKLLTFIVDMPTMEKGLSAAFPFLIT